MKLSRALPAAVLLGVAMPLLAQDAPYEAEMRFVNELRKRRYNDLALEYLGKLEKTASPALKKELPLEIAKTQLETAADEPDTSKRLAQYRDSQEKFKQFLAQNKNHPRTAEVKFDLARVLVLQGRTELSRAWLQGSLEARATEGVKARATFVQAGEALKAAAVEIGKALDLVRESTAPDDKAQAKKLEEQALQCELEKGLNLFNIGETYLDESKDAVLIERAKEMQLAQQALEKLAAQDATSPICWQAKAWAARCYHELGEARKARQHFTEILGATSPQAAEGRRLARYFRMLILADAKIPPEPADKGKVPALILEAGNSWLQDYPAYRNTTEANGVRFLLAGTYLAETKVPRLPPETKRRYLDRANSLLTAIEATENEFTDRARGLKIAVVRERGSLQKDLSRLTSFDEFYIRAQYEISQMADDAKDGTPQEQEEKHKKRIATIIQALSAGLARPEAVKKRSPEVNNARSLLAFYALQAGDTKRAIEVGEAFARLDPRAGQAGSAAAYALQGYLQELAGLERGSATPEEIKATRDRMLALAHYMKERWPKDAPGNFARHQLGSLLLREKNLADGIKELTAIGPDYPSYTVSQYQLAEACMQAERDKLEPIPGDKPDGYRTRAIAALQSIPELVAGADALTCQMFMLARVKLLQEWFKVKKFKEMQELAGKLAPLAGTLKFNDDPAKHAEMSQYFKKSLGEMRLYGLYGQAQADFDKGQHTAVVTLLDPLVAEARANPEHPVIKNQQLGNALLSMELRSNIQLGKLDQARQVIPLLQALARESGTEAGTTAVLKQLIAIMQRQLEEMSKKDEAALAKTRAGFTAILDDLTKQETKQAKPGLEFILLLAQNYAVMGEHKKAADQLAAVADPGPADVQARKFYQAIRLLLVRQLRLNKELEKARTILYGEILGKDGKGWGARNIEALLEEVQLLELDGDFAAGARKANVLVKGLIKKVNDDSALKEKYFEAYYHVVYCFLKHGQNAVDAATRDKYIKEAANQVLALEKRWMGLGTDTSARRFQDLLDGDKDLKAAYDTAKKADEAPAAK